MLSNYHQISVIVLAQLKTHLAFNCYSSKIYNDHVKRQETVTFNSIPDMITIACKFRSIIEITYLPATHYIYQNLLLGKETLVS